MVKKIDITLDNYEAFLLERYEGIITPERDQALTKFLESHGKEDMGDSRLFYFDSDDIVPEGSKDRLSIESLKHNAPSEAEEKMLFDAIEDNLTADDFEKLNKWLNEDKILNRHYNAFAATRLDPDDRLSFPDKAGLKKTVAVRRFLYLAVAACMTGILLTFGINLFNKGTAPNTHEMAFNQDEMLQKDGSIVKMQQHQIPAAADKDGLINITNLKNSKEAGSPEEVAVSSSESKIIVKNNDLPESGNHKETENFERIYKSDKAGDIGNMALVDLERDQKSIDQLPRIPVLGSSGVVSLNPSKPDDIIFSNYPEISESSNIVFQGLKERIRYLDRKSNAIYGFVETQREIVKKEGLFDVAGTYNDKGHFDGLAIRIAGFEITTNK